MSTCGTITFSVTKESPIALESLRKRKAGRHPKKWVEGEWVYYTNAHGTLFRYPLEVDSINSLTHLVRNSFISSGEKARCKKRRRVATGNRGALATSPLRRAYNAYENSTKSTTNKKRGCRCALHTEFHRCVYCPAVGCTKCTWIGYDEK